jgi:hypothetical protein
MRTFVSSGSLLLACCFLAGTAGAQSAAAFPELEPSEEAAAETGSSETLAPSPVAARTAAPSPWDSAQPYAPYPRDSRGGFTAESGRPLSTRWYGWQMLVADAVALGLMLAATDDAGLAGAVLYLGSGPVIHGAHGRGEALAGSLGLRLGAPVAGGALGNATCTDRTGSLACVEETAIGILLGMGVAVAIDAALLAREPAPPRREAERAVRLAPALTLTPGRASLSLGGIF